jgi:hypothetical protein
MIRALLALAALSTAACIPTPANSECRARVNNCLGNCTPVAAPQSDSLALTGDTRTACERDCESLCH